MPSISGIAHVELSVSDADASAAWYVRLLNAREVFRGGSDEYGIDAVAIVEPESRVVLAVTAHRTREDGAFSARRVGLDHLSFLVSSREELDAWAAHLDGLGVAHSGVRNDGNGWGMTFADPDGIALEIIARTPRPAAT